MSEQNNTKTKKSKRTLQVVVGLLLVLIGLLFIISPWISGKLVHSMTENKLDETSHFDAESLRKAKKQAAKELQKEDTQDGESLYQFDSIEPASLKEVLEAQMSDKGVHPIGVLAIDKLDLRLPILKGVTNYNMLVGAGTMKPGQQFGKGNFSLASHNMNNDKTLFSAIHRLEKNNKIYVTDYSKVYVYRVTTNKVVSPTSVDVINDVAGKKLLTLVTCTLDGKKRIIIQAKLHTVEPLDDDNTDIFE